ncbi:hypothetical protein HDV00_002100 [Rhizophlyctis rosea]|nr:hypothetical protein HDV00_002100 [Rhizophlyctis rosea]
MSSHLAFIYITCLKVITRAYGFALFFVANFERGNENGRAACKVACQRLERLPVLGIMLRLLSVNQGQVEHVGNMSRWMDTLLSDLSHLQAVSSSVDEQGEAVVMPVLSDNLTAVLANAEMNVTKETNILDTLMDRMSTNKQAPKAPFIKGTRASPSVSSNTARTPTPSPQKGKDAPTHKVNSPNSTTSPTKGNGKVQSSSNRDFVRRNINAVKLTSRSETPQPRHTSSKTHPPTTKPKPDHPTTASRLPITKPNPPAKSNPHKKPDTTLETSSSNDTLVDEELTLVPVRTATAARTLPTMTDEERTHFQHEQNLLAALMFFLGKWTPEAVVFMVLFIIGCVRGVMGLDVGDGDGVGTRRGRGRGR